MLGPKGERRTKSIKGVWNAGLGGSFVVPPGAGCADKVCLRACDRISSLEALAAQNLSLVGFRVDHGLPAR